MASQAIDDRMNGSPPLEGLAASLRARVIAQLNSKDEDVDRHRRSDLVAPMHAGPINSNNTIQLVQAPHVKTEKYSAGMKRTSPIIENPPRPPKMLYTDCSDAMINSDLLHVGRGGSGPSRGMGPLMSPEINSLSAVDDRQHLLRHGRNDVDVGSSSSSSNIAGFHQQQHQQPSSSSSVKVINLPYGSSSGTSSANTGCSNPPGMRNYNHHQQQQRSMQQTQHQQQQQSHQQYRIQSRNDAQMPPAQRHHHYAPNKYPPNSYSK